MELSITPQALFDYLNEIHHFDLDVVASKENAKCSSFFSEELDALSRPWFCHSAWANYPYSAQHPLHTWITKAYGEVFVRKHCDRLIMLLPCDTSTQYFHEYFWQYSQPKPYLVDLYFIPCRVHFSGLKQAPSFASMLVGFGTKVFPYPEQEPTRLEWLRLCK